VSDFNWDGGEFDNSDDNLFGDSNNKEDFFKRVNRMMFIDDIEKFPMSIVPLAPSEFNELFGKPSTEDLSIISNVFMKDVFKFNESFVIDKWGPEWMYEILQFNIQREEYELCSTIHKIIENSQSELLKKYFKIQ